MEDCIQAYEAVSVNEVEHILNFARQAWLHGFPVIAKEDGRSREQLHVHACILLLVLTGCISNSQNGDAGVMAAVSEDMQKQGRLSLDALDFLALVRSPGRYTKEAISSRKKPA